MKLDVSGEGEGGGPHRETVVEAEAAVGHRHIFRARVMPHACRRLIPVHARRGTQDIPARPPHKHRGLLVRSFLARLIK